jgi:hypothetical protein
MKSVTATVFVLGLLTLVSMNVGAADEPYEKRFAINRDGEIHVVFYQQALQEFLNGDPDDDPEYREWETRFDMFEIVDVHLRQFQTCIGTYSDMRDNETSDERKQIYNEYVLKFEKHYLYYIFAAHRIGAISTVIKDAMILDRPNSTNRSIAAIRELRDKRSTMANLKIAKKRTRCLLRLEKEMDKITDKVNKASLKGSEP